MRSNCNRGAWILAAVAAVSVPQFAHGVGYYYGGYDTTLNLSGSPTLPVSGPFVVSGQTTFYSSTDGTVSGATIPNAAGTGFVTANDTSAELVLGGSAAGTAYTANTPSGTSTAAIRSIILLANNPGTNTLNFGLSGGGRFTFAGGGTGTVFTVGTGTPSIIGVGIYQGGSANWDFTNTGSATAALRAQNSFNISGPGSGNISIPFNIANVSGTPSLGVTLTGGATLTLGARNDFSGSGGTPNFSLNAGTVDFRNGRSFGNLNVQIRLNGGTLVSGNGSTIDSGYAGNGGTAGEAPIRIGGNVTLGGSTAWSTGTLGVTLNASRIITAANTSATGVTIGGPIGEVGGTAFGLTVAGTGTLTLAGAVNYTGATTVNSGKLVLGPASQAGTGGLDVKGGQAVLQYSGTSNVDTIRTALANSFNDPATPGVIDTGAIRSGTATATRGLGYKDDGAGAVTIKPALFGDADLDGGVSINDFNALAGAFGQSGKYWVDGDFDYDGGISINDFNLLAGGFGQSLPPSSEAWAGLLAFAAAHNDLAAFEAVTGVPEPTSLALLAAGTTLGLRRRRR